MATDNLFDVLQASKVDQSELEQVLIEYFHNAQQLNSDEILYGSDKLRLRYADGTLFEIAPGPGLKPPDIEGLTKKIEADLLQEGPSKVGRQVLFTAVPVRGWFRYQNIFQILPVPPEAPTPPFLHGQHPFLIEFRFPSSPNIQIRIVRRSNLERELELICSALLLFQADSIGKHARHHWVLANPMDVENWRSSYCQEMYTWPGAAVELERFTSTDDTQALEKVDPQKYYSQRGISAGQHLTIPDNFEQLLTKVFSLPREVRDRFLRASFWFQHSHHVHYYSQSAVFIALVGAIESLMPPPQGQSRCKECGQITGPGSTKRFADFVDRLVPGIPQSDRKAFYAVRSALSHGGTLLIRDRAGWGLQFTPRQLKEFSNTSAVWEIVRSALVNWLASQ